MQLKITKYKLVMSLPMKHVCNKKNSSSCNRKKKCVNFISNMQIFSTKNT